MLLAVVAIKHLGERVHLIKLCYVSAQETLHLGTLHTSLSRMTESKGD